MNDTTVNQHSITDTRYVTPDYEDVVFRRVNIKDITNGTVIFRVDVKEMRMKNFYRKVNELLMNSIRRM